MTDLEREPEAEEPKRERAKRRGLDARRELRTRTGPAVENTKPGASKGLRDGGAGLETTPET